MSFDFNNCDIFSHGLSHYLLKIGYYMEIEIRTRVPSKCISTEHMVLHVILYYWRRDRRNEINGAVNGVLSRKSVSDLTRRI